MLFADRPELEGKNLLDMRDAQGRYIIKDMIKIAKQSSEGFYDYHWTKPGAKGNGFKKIVFIKRFEPYDWFMGTGLYADDVEKRIKADLLSDISSIRFGKQGYIFVNRLNGDALVSNGKCFSGTKKLWEVFDKNPEKMKSIFEKEYTAALKPDGGYIYYSHIKLTDPAKESPKVSFIYGIPELQWIVGAGVYLDDIEAVIGRIQRVINNQIRMRILYDVLIIVGIIIFSFFLLNRLSRRLKNDFNLFISFFNRAALSDDPIDRNLIRFDELDRMAQNANKMLADRKKTEAALRKSEAKYRLIADNVSDIIWTMDMNLRFTYISPSVRKLIGYTPYEAMRTSLKKALTPESYARVVQMIRNAIAEENNSNVSSDAALTLELEHIRKDGGTVWAEVTASFTRDKDGSASGFIGITRDITARRQAEKEREKLQAQLIQAQKMESVGRLAGGVAHDYNNALSVIIGFTEMAIDEVKTDDPVRDDLDEILKAARRAENITRQLLAFARRQIISPKVIDLNDNIESMLKMLRRLIGEDIDLTWSPGADLWPVNMDPSQVDQILANLCVNARDAIDDVGRIVIETENIILDEDYCADHPGFVPGKFVMLSVSDNGCGMEKDVLENIFEPFFTTKEVGRGTGLGMSTVYGIAKQNNGFVNVYSEPGQGTSVKIYLPRHKGKAVGNENESASQIQQGCGETILVVEDDLLVLKLTRRILEGLGYTVLTADTPEAAIGLAKEHVGAIDLLITDVIMPGMNGHELSQQLKAFYPDLKNLFMSGYTANIIARRGVLIEGAQFIQKPFSRRGLATAVKKALGSEN